nr:6002_t:CDS:10 [Entrophospora candida]
MFLLIKKLFKRAPMTELNYRNKLILAPMVRIGTLPLRLLALEFGAEETGVIEYIDKQNTMNFQTLPIEKSKLIFQIGTSDPDLALKAALKVKEDVSGIDVNCGCPKKFSIQGGMGAALLSNPEKLKAIEGCNSLIVLYLSFRILDTKEKTIELCKMIESTGVKAIAVHCRTRNERPRQPGHWEIFKDIVENVKSIPIIANGDIFQQSDIIKLKELSTQSNVSIFCKDGLLPLNEVATMYIKKAMMIRNHFPNTKYTILQMYAEKSKEPVYKSLTQSKTYQDLCKIFNLKDESVLSQNNNNVDVQLDIEKHEQNKIQHEKHEQNKPHDQMKQINKQLNEQQQNEQEHLPLKNDNDDDDTSVIEDSESNIEKEHLSNNKLIDSSSQLVATLDEIEKDENIEDKEESNEKNNATIENLENNNDNNNKHEQSAQNFELNKPTPIDIITIHENIEDNIIKKDPYNDDNNIEDKNKGPSNDVNNTEEKGHSNDVNNNEEKDPSNNDNDKNSSNEDNNEDKDSSNYDTSDIIDAPNLENNNNIIDAFSNDNNSPLNDNNSNDKDPSNDDYNNIINASNDSNNNIINSSNDKVSHDDDNNEDKDTSNNDDDGNVALNSNEDGDKDSSNDDNNNIKDISNKDDDVAPTSNEGNDNVAVPLIGSSDDNNNYVKDISNKEDDDSVAYNSNEDSDIVIVTASSINNDGDYSIDENNIVKNKDDDSNAIGTFNEENDNLISPVSSNDYNISPDDESNDFKDTLNKSEEDNIALTLNKSEEDNIALTLNKSEEDNIALTSNEEDGDNITDASINNKDVDTNDITLQTAIKIVDENIEYNYSVRNRGVKRFETSETDLPSKRTKIEEQSNEKTRTHKRKLSESVFEPILCILLDSEGEYGSEDEYVYEFESEYEYESENESETKLELEKKKESEQPQILQTSSPSMVTDVITTIGNKVSNNYHCQYCD